MISFEKLPSGEKEACVITTSTCRGYTRAISCFTVPYSPLVPVRRFRHLSKAKNPGAHLVLNSTYFDVTSASIALQSALQIIQVRYYLILCYLKLSNALELT